MLKPSERIYEIQEKLKEESGIETPPAFIIKSILDYLDEEWEKNKTIEQRQIDTLDQK